MKQLIKSSISKLIRQMSRASRHTRFGQYLHEEFLDAMMRDVASVKYKRQEFLFCTPNALATWRAQTFATKEPETLAWIDQMPKGSVLWDIGANVGTYAIYAAKMRDASVWAFEPSIFNLELLGRNIYLNDLTDKICIVPCALSDCNKESAFQMTSTNWGGALSTFDKDVGWDGKKILPTFKYKTIGMSMQDCADMFSLPKPDYIKIDVDGIEHFILKGGEKILKDIRGILIEVNDGFSEQAEQCHDLLMKSGLFLHEKAQAEMMASSTTGFQHSFNQIWQRV